jgi:hypothetical protein
MKNEIDPIPDRADSAEHERLIQRLLTDPNQQDALTWLKADTLRTIGASKTNQASIEYVEQIRRLGALKIVAVRIHSKTNAKGERSGKLVVRLPIEQSSRDAIFEWCKRQGESLGFSPDTDKGESHLFLLLD